MFGDLDGDPLWMEWRTEKQNAGRSGAQPRAGELEDPAPSRANVLTALAVADRSPDTDQACYQVQRAIAETLLLILVRATERTPRVVGT